MNKFNLFFVIIFSLILVSAFVNAETFISFSLKLDRTDGLTNNVVLLEKGLITSRSQVSAVGDYRIELEDYKGNLLFIESFNAYFEVFTDEFDDDGNHINPDGADPYFELNSTEVVVFSPYFKNVHTLKIFHGYNLLLEENISDLAVCNYNGICDEAENLNRCPEDCSIVETSDLNSKKDLEYSLNVVQDTKLNWWQKFVRFIKKLFGK